jgi:hypothetical protein
MSQFDFATIDPNAKSGTQLAVDLNNWRDALHSGHRGASRPSYAQAGMHWVREVSGEQWDLMFYDGTNDFIIRSVNPSTGQLLDIPQDQVAGLPEAIAEIGQKQAADPLLAALAALTVGAGQFLAFTGNDAAAARNIVGTVSQSSGVPTGAIVERGSNSNGEYIRWADGTQICYALLGSGTQLATAAGNLFRTGTNTWTFPAAFADEPSFHPHSDGSPGYSWGAIGSNTTSTTAASWSVFGPSSSANAPQAHLIAIGRWY